MNKRLKVATEQATGYCKDCSYYNRNEMKCEKIGDYIRRKNTCEDFIERK